MDSNPPTAPFELPEVSPVMDERTSRALDSFLKDFESLHDIEERLYERLSNYAGKLTILAGATIPLTFTALSMFWAKMPSGYRFSYLSELFWAWALLVGVMILGVASQKSHVYAASYHRAINHAQLMSMRRDVVVAVIRGPAAISEAPKIADEPFYMQAESRIKMLDVVSKWTLYLAEGAAVIAFLLLVHFVETNFGTIAGR